MPEYMLDTNICMYVMKTYPPAVREKFNLLADELCISSMTSSELYYGAEKIHQRSFPRRMLASIRTASEQSGPSAEIAGTDPDPRIQPEHGPVAG